MIANPAKGRTIRGCGGLRKVRVSDPSRSKGKRSGARIIYLYVPEERWFFMLDVYGKDEKDDLNAAECKELASLAALLKMEAAKSRRNRG